ncbi:hypothetical protein [uncultured Pseudoflavonifractor sp.]|uniref:hypothetical protein n=1 Tax=uncultured Pseudoflavonifractor sp. TaxID=1221379 RepID=UPI0025EB7B85|nr:hypothetical protein [uncultured Pseudoflavonifractor sp.]
MKRLFALLLSSALALALAACGPAQDSPAPGGATPPPTESAQPAPSPTGSQPAETAPGTTPPQESLPPEETEEPAEPELPLSADYAAEDLLSRPEDYDLLVLDESEYRVDVAITASETVTGVQVASLTLEEVGEDDVGFRIEAVLGTLDAIKPGRPFVVAMAFPGSIPNTALIFTGPDGAVCCCTISMSGKDGSLLLIPFEPIPD